MATKKNNQPEEDSSNRTALAGENLPAAAGLGAPGDDGELSAGEEPQLVLMERTEIEPFTADVHPDEVEHWLAAGWQIQQLPKETGAS